MMPILAILWKICAKPDSVHGSSSCIKAVVIDEDLFVMIFAWIGLHTSQLYCLPQAEIKNQSLGNPLNSHLGLEIRSTITRTKTTPGSVRCSCCWQYYSQFNNKSKLNLGKVHMLACLNFICTQREISPEEI